jgi:hypothetical protein
MITKQEKVAVNTIDKQIRKEKKNYRTNKKIEEYL